MSMSVSKPDESNRAVTGQKLFVIYYGWLIEDVDGTPNDAARAIAAARPDLLIVSFYTFEPKHTNLSKQILDLFHQAGILVIAYVDTNYGKRDYELVKTEVDDYLGQKVDGIFLDQVYNFLDDEHTAYYQNLYNHIKNQSKLVISNTGISTPGEAIMQVTDILMVEQAWRDLYQTNPWFAAYSSERFMGNSSNEYPEHYPDFQMNADSAVRHTKEAWAKGIGWHFSTDNYITLPDWFPQYVTKLNRDPISDAAGLNENPEQPS